MSASGKPTTPPPEGETRVSQKLAGLVVRARKEQQLTNVMGFVDEELLRLAFYALRRDAAAGIDGQTWHDYEAMLTANLEDVYARLKEGRYRAPMIRRVRIPKAGGGSRPLGITTIEDRMVQKAVAWVLEAVYEPDFLDCSHGYRPQRSGHTALHQVHGGLERRGVRAVVEVDIQGYFDHVNRVWLHRFLRHRITDGGLHRLIGKWLQAGVLDGGVVTRTEEGVPQGGPISPILANLYLHYVLDLWFEHHVKRSSRGYVQLVRYADDLVALFAQPTEAERFRQEVETRLEAFGLHIAVDKTGVVPFDGGPGAPKPGTFTFLGFVHYVTMTRRGRRTVKRKPSRKARERFLQRLSGWLATNRHLPVRTHQAHLTQALRGYYQYFGIRDSTEALSTVHWRTQRLWQRALQRRSQKATRATDWESLHRQSWFRLPAPSVTHPWV